MNLWKQFLLLGGIILLYSTKIYGQIDYDEYKKSTKSILIKNVLIVKNPDIAPSLGSILVRDGKIEQIGPNIKKPIDARTVEADSMYAYPAFIAGMSNVGMKKADDEKDAAKPKIKFTGLPPNDYAGITPEVLASSVYDHKESSIAQFREAGFALANTAPLGRMLPGTSAVISLTGKDKNEVFLNQSSGIFSQFKAAPRVYPATIIAIMAKWRDLYKNAELAGKYIPQYGSNPNIGTRPSYDEATRALIPLTHKTMPVYFKTSNSKECFRAMTLQKELGFNMVLTDLNQGWRAINEIKRSGVSVLLSTDLPKEIKDEKDSDEDEGDKEEGEDDQQGKDGEVDKMEEKKSEEQLMFEKKKKKAHDESVAQASFFEKENVLFGFSFIEGSPKDLQKNLSRMVKAGLSKKKALDALTSYPAKLLGIDKNAGSLEKSKDANIMIRDKDYFEEDSKIRYMFIEGHMYEFKEKEKKKSSGKGESLDLKGKWSYKVDVFGETESGWMVIKRDGDELSIELFSNDEPDDPSNGENIKVDGNKLSFDFEADTDGGSMKKTMDIDFDGEDFKGNVSAPFGSQPISGSKLSSPE